ncbi:hypothetical protein WME76_04210 [Sorangium sp. So ce119]|uniref:hypothetical protein n=1 Tax=Sorangium sp. So ce119 TaxID=3133279 RepID=UPI003F618049
MTRARTLARRGLLEGRFLVDASVRQASGPKRRAGITKHASSSGELAHLGGLRRGPGAGPRFTTQLLLARRLRPG